MRALIVDDSRATRMILAQILGGLGFEVVQAGGGRQGLEQLVAGPAPELALVDWHMPELNGIDFIRAVRAESRFRDVRLVLVSGEEAQAHVAMAREAGADGYITKPFTRDGILERLRGMGLCPSL